MANIINYSSDFDNIIAIIEKSKMRAIKAVNREMIEMYWQIGQYLSEKTENDGWGKKNRSGFCRLSEKNVSFRKRFFRTEYVEDEAVLRNVLR